MAQKVARVNDKVQCLCIAHGNIYFGTILTGSATVTVDGRAVARLNDTGLLDCGHTFKIIGSSAVSSADGIGVARANDQVQCLVGGTGFITTGSDNVNSE